MNQVWNSIMDISNNFKMVYLVHFLIEYLLYKWSSWKCQFLKLKKIEMYIDLLVNLHIKSLSEKGLVAITGSKHDNSFSHQQCAPH